MPELNFENMTFESLLNIEDTTVYESEYPELDLLEVAQECADIECEIYKLENAETMLEGAKLVKKAQSKKTKKKLKKTKMSAKAAKAAKKSGRKVVKVTREGEDGEEEVLDETGGSGPQPTTSDTNDLTENDVQANKLDEVADATPDAEVTVTEIDEDAPEEAAVGTEGVDFIVEYESAAIVTYEASIKEIGGKIVEYIKKLFDKLIELWNRVATWVMKFFKVNEGYWKKHEEEIKANYPTIKDKKIKVSKKLVAVINAFEAGSINEAGNKIIDKLNGFKGADAAEMPVVEVHETEKEEIEISKLTGPDYKQIQGTFTAIPKKVKEGLATTKEVYKALMAKAKKIEDKDGRKNARKAASTFYRAARTAIFTLSNTQFVCKKIMGMCVNGEKKDEGKKE